MNNKKAQAYLQLGIVIAIIFILNFLVGLFPLELDLTEDGKYSLTEPTKQLIAELDDNVYVTIYLEGEFPAGFRRLQQSTIELMDKLRSINYRIDYAMVNPNEGTTDEINQMREKLKGYGIFPTRLSVVDNAERSEQYIFPFATVAYKGRITSVALLEAQTPGMGQEVVLNNSVGLLEYKFAHAIKSLQTAQSPYVVFTKGHGELNEFETADFEKSLRQFYEVGRIDLDSVVKVDQKIDVVIVAKPRAPFSDQEKFKIDQYIMNGGKVIWLIDKLAVNLDSLQGKEAHVPFEYGLELDKMFFRYGFRITTDLVLDLTCTKIPQVVGMQGNSPQFEYFDWWYHPMVTTTNVDHPIVKNLDRTNLLFTTVIDTVKTKTNVKKTVLLSSSDKSRIQKPPVRLSFEILRYPPVVERFNKKHLPVGVLLEGEFPSFFQNKVTAEMAQGLQQLGMDFKPQSSATKMLVVSDGDIAKNFINRQDNSYKPLGYNPYMRYKFANKDFLLNALEYMIDEKGVIAARTKEVKLRLIDKVKAQEGKIKWQLINIVLPLIFLLIFGVGYNYWRRQKYAQ